MVTKQAVLVAWALNPAFTEPGPYRFKLQRGRAVTDDKWVDVSETVDQPWLYDYHPLFSQHDRSTVYRVILVDGNGVEYISQATSIYQDWSHLDWRLMREIIRKETLGQHKFGGTRGWLIKRRQWGDPCTACVDPNTGTVTNSHCEICLGTGIIAGYYDPLEYWVTMNPNQRMKRLQPDQGVVAAIIETVRGLAWPAPEENDIWVQHGTNRRFRIQPDIQAIARHRGIDVVLDLRLEELPLENVAYSIPTP